MLQVLRKSASSIFIKVLFLLLVVSFAIWGIGDMFHFSGNSDTAAEVGDREISGTELSNAFRQELNRLRPLNIDSEQAQKMGVVDQVLHRMVARTLYNIEASELGIRASDATVLAHIHREQAFHNEAGQFDRQRFEQLLSANGLTEDAFVAILRSDVARQQMLDSVTKGTAAPDPLVDVLYRWRAERRIAEILPVAVDPNMQIGKPDEATLETFYKEHEQRFTAPEYRKISYVHLRPEDLAAEIGIPEEKLRQAYERRIDEFVVPETRSVRQIVLPDEEHAKQAYEMLSKGRDVFTVASELAKQGADATDLGKIAKADLPVELADPVFALEKGGVTQPINGPFGWHVLKVTEIEPGKTRPFEEVRDKLHKDLAREEAVDALYKLSNRLEDALGGGATLKEAADQLNLALYRLEPIDRQGNNQAGLRMPDLPGQPFLQTAFESEPNRESALTETQQGGYFILRVDEVIPSALKPLDKVREEAVKLWQEEQRKEAARKKAESIVKRLNEGADLTKIATELGVKTSTTEPVSREGDGAGTKLPPAIVGDLFTLDKPGQAVMAEDQNRFVIARLKSIQPADPEKDKEQVENIRKDLRGAVANDLLVQFNDALRKRHGVEIHKQTVRRLFPDAV